MIRALLCAFAFLLIGSAADARAIYKKCPNGMIIKRTQSCSSTVTPAPAPAPTPAPTPPAPPSFAVGDVSVSENAGNATLHIVKSKANGFSSIVSYSTANGTATAGSDYGAVSGTLTIPDATADTSVTVPIFDDTTYEGPETFSFSLTPSSNAIIGRQTATVTINDNETPPTGWVLSPSLAGANPIASEFDPATSIYASYQPNPQPPEEPVGAFRFICAAGQLLYDDPLVYPGQPGRSHLHQFYGNLGANASSTANSLRTTGHTTCGDPLANPANRSGYWVAALLDGKGNVVQPDFAQLYYKRNPKDSAVCQPNSDGSPNKWGISSCSSIPNNIRFIFGYNMATGQAAQYPWRWNCDATGTEDTNMVAPLATCPVGSMLFARQQAPTCWDGTHLDSPDHRSHVVYMQDTHNGYFACPPGYPVGIAALSLAFGYRIAVGDDTSLWKLSSDVMHPELPPGSTMHADYFEAWDPTIKQIWTDNCIDRMLNCVGGALGNGYSIHGAETPYYVISGVSTPLWQNPNHLVPVP